MKTLTAAILVLLLPGLVLAGGYGYQPYYYPQYVPYYVKYPVAVYEPVKVVAYTASYVEPQQTTERLIEKTTTTTKEVIQTEAVSHAATQQVQQVQTQKVTKDCHGVSELAAALKSLQEEVARLKSGRPVPAPEPLPAQSMTQQKCGACHTASSANAKGGGFVLVENDGKLATLSLPDKGRTVRRVDNGTMPPPSAGTAPLTEAEKVAIKNEVAPSN